MSPGFRFVTATLSMLAVMSTARAGDDKTPAAQNSPAAPASKNPKSPRVLVTISKETTYITEPLRKDGYVDYVAALNERASKGVTPENNAAVLFWKAIGPAEIEPNQRDEFFKILGIAALPEKGDYFVPLERYLTTQGKNEKEIGAADDTLFSATQHVWSTREFPMLARWLEINDKPLSLLSEASKRPRRYDPLIANGSPPVITARLPAIRAYIDVSSALVARAMLRINDGKTVAAWDDLLAAHRLARLLGQGGNLNDELSAASIDSAACHGDEAQLQRVHLSSADAKRISSDLLKLPPLPKSTEKIVLNERFQVLDATASLARDGLETMAKLGGRKPDGTSVAEIDWNIILRMTNSWYDRMTDALQQPTRAKRVAACDEVNRDFERLAAKLKDKPSMFLSVLVNSRSAVSERMGGVVIAMFLPSLKILADCDDRTAMRFEIVKLGLALAAYHADHGSFPAKLTELAPQYVASVPKDVFNNDELKFTRQGDGYLLYSVGPNGIDEGGKEFDEAGEQVGDDISIRFPASVTYKRKR
jgi:hypothetical protein